MKQFILKNIVLVVILIVTLISSIFLAFFIWDKSQTLDQSMKAIADNVRKVEEIEEASKPNSVEQSEKMIKVDTETLTGKKAQIYRHFGRPYRPALLKLIKNIASSVELQTNLPTDPDLVAEPIPKSEDEDADDEEQDQDVAESSSAEPSAPSDEEKAVFNPATKLVILSFDEDKLREMLKELYGEIQHEDSDETFVIPDNIQAERELLFKKLFNKIIEAPEAVDPSRAEDFRNAAAAKFAKAFALFREEVQELTLEDVTYKVAHELFLDALGLPRLMRQRDCKNYVDVLYEKYLASNIIPGIVDREAVDRERFVQDFIYSKNLSRQALPVPDMVIPILRNFQIKEDLFRRMKTAGVKRLNSMTAGSFYGTPASDNDGILVFTYTIDMTLSMEAIEAFINSLHSAYKLGSVYVIKDIKLTAPYDDLINANAIVAGHSESRSAASDSKPAPRKQTIQPDDDDDDEEEEEDPEAARLAALAASRNQYDLTDPHNPEYGKTLVGERRDEIRCSIVVNYLFYREDNITPQ